MNAIEKRKIQESHSVDDLTLTSNRFESSKLQYIKQMMYQYLVCRDADVKDHLEIAFESIFQFSQKEREAIEARRKESVQDTLTSISSYLSLGSK